MTTCRHHPGTAATIRCDECGRTYCRDCVVERWVTSRSSVWVCRRCAGRWQPSAGGGVAVPAAVGRYLPLAVVVALAALIAATHGVHLLG
jgi:ribosomal protein S27E